MTPIVTEKELTEALVRCGSEVTTLRAENARLAKAGMAQLKSIAASEIEAKKWFEYAQELRAENARLREALLPLALIADAYDDNALDDEARKSGAWGENTRPPAKIELYQGRGGKQLLTLHDAFAARQALGGTDDPAI